MFLYFFVIRSALKLGWGVESFFAYNQDDIIMRYPCWEGFMDPFSDIIGLGRQK